MIGLNSKDAPKACFHDQEMARKCLIGQVSPQTQLRDIQLKRKKKGRIKGGDGKQEGGIQKNQKRQRKRERERARTCIHLWSILCT